MVNKDVYSGGTKFSPNADFDSIKDSDGNTLEQVVSSIKTSIENVKSGAYNLTELNVGYIGADGEKHGAKSATRCVYKVAKSELSSSSAIIDALVGGAGIAVVSYWNNDVFVKYDTSVGVGTNARVNKTFTLPTNIEYTDVYISVNPSESFSLKAMSEFQEELSEMDERIDSIEYEIDNISFSSQIKNIHICRKSLDDECNILYVGSSWMQDNFDLVQEVATGSGIKANVYNWYLGSATFDDLLANWESSTITMIGKRHNSFKDYVQNCSIKSAIEYKQWDVIVIANGAAASASWSNFANGFKFLRLVKMYAPQATLATYYGWVPLSQIGTQSEWVNRLNIYKKWVSKSGIDVTIPTGMALWSMMSTSYGSDTTNMFRDTLHLSYGFGRYLSACTNFVAILTPMYGVNVVGNTFRGPSEYTITDQQAQDAQMFALSANGNQYEFIDMSDEIDG